MGWWWCCCSCFCCSMQSLHNSYAPCAGDRAVSQSVRQSRCVQNWQPPLQPAISPTQSEERASKNGSQENFKLRFWVPTEAEAEMQLQLLLLLLLQLHLHLLLRAFNCKWSKRGAMQPKRWQCQLPASTSTLSHCQRWWEKSASVGGITTCNGKLQMTFNQSCWNW